MRTNVFAEYFNMSVHPMIGIVCGLKSEAAVVRRACEAVSGLNVRIGVSGARAAAARNIAVGFAQDDAKFLLSVGVSGGLDPSLTPGTLLLSRNILTPNGAAIGSLDHALFHVRPFAEAHGRWSTLLGSDEIITSPDEKARLFAQTGAHAVDMESHGVAEAARDAGCTFMAIRAIADAADRALPPPALDAVAPDGSTRVLSTLFKAARAPKHFPALVKLGRDSDAALGALGAVLPDLLQNIASHMEP